MGRCSVFWHRYLLTLVAGGGGRLDHYLVRVEISWCRLGRRVGWGCVPMFGDVFGVWWWASRAMACPTAWLWVLAAGISLL